MKCDICGISDKKYKCPVCLINYCSKECFGKHKEKCSKEISKSKGPELKKPRVSVSAPKETIYSEVPDEKLELLGQSEELKDLLKNQHLQKLLKIVDGSKDPEKMMQMAMLEPLFVEYVDVCMSLGNEESS
ncbi:zinc finger HIT domain-containing protein 3-like [Harmonia axyridis]|uniref:zinc finger HIT domain-containing protein 3-like n=1 Tax=Harmonia axyridis TaxID=115357 RepID=UPI001E274F3B|nr:zinc finger HIT domain-containing protein 3-like [Harmonia axyridis]XP_045478044.1 zinc finger HIT domain-containing protein 3-like [Harmonia axyridis]